MKRRIIRTFFTGLLLLLVATVGMWVRSYRKADWITYQWATSPGEPYRHCRASVLSARGYFTPRIEFVRGANPSDNENETWLRNLHNEVWAGWNVQHYEADTAWVDLDEGIADESFGSHPATVMNRHSIPIRFIYITLATFISCCLFGYAVARRQRSAGLCSNCCYDLRAHKPGDKCPECGTSMAAKPSEKL